MAHIYKKIMRYRCIFTMLSIVNIAESMHSEVAESFGALQQGLDQLRTLLGNDDPIHIIEKDTLSRFSWWVEKLKNFL